MTNIFRKQTTASRTVWMIIILFLINGVTGIRAYIPAFWLPLVDGVLGILAVYFRVDQKQDFKS